MKQPRSHLSARRATLLFAVWIAWLGCGTTGRAKEGRAIEYKAELSGLKNRSLAKTIEESTQTFRLQDRSPETRGLLRRRINADLPRIKMIMEANGYYDATVTTQIKTDHQPYTVVFTITPGEPYLFREIKIEFAGGHAAALDTLSTRLRQDRPAVATVAIAEQRRIMKKLQQSGFPFPSLLRRTVNIDREHKRVDLTMVFDPGTKAIYGDLLVEGLKTLKPSYIQRQLNWKPGDAYDAQQLSNFENKLLGTGLFGTAKVEALPPEPGALPVPVKVTLTERDLRTIRLGGGYSDIGVNGKVFWEHRNLFGGGEHLETSIGYSPILQGGKVSLTRPGFLRANQSIIWTMDIAREMPEAYDTDRTETGLVVQRDFSRHVLAGTGVRYKYSRVEQLNETDTYNHLIFPLYGALDYRNDKLNPVSGGQLMGRFRYYKDLERSDSFAKTEIEGRLYRMLWKRPRLSAAGRLLVGNIAGAAVGRVPADERFYAGGGGSIRGYEYQKIGPLVDGVARGGTQLLEFSTELRIQPGNKLGYAAFLDGGTAYTDLDEDTARALRYGAGVGLRIFTPIGPLRADFAYPLNPADGMVERLQFYISLGQAF